METASGTSESKSKTVKLENQILVKMLTRKEITDDSEDGILGLKRRPTQNQTGFASRQAYITVTIEPKDGKENGHKVLQLFEKTAIKGREEKHKRECLFYQRYLPAVAAFSEMKVNR